MAATSGTAQDPAPEEGGSTLVQSWVETLRSDRAVARDDLTSMLSELALQGDPDERKAAVEALARGFPAGEALATFKQLVGSSDVDVRLWSARGIAFVWRSPDPPPRDSGLLVPLLRDPDPWVRAAAVDGLGWMSTDAGPGLRATLAGLAGDEFAEVRVEVVRSLGRLGGLSDDEVEALAARSSDSAIDGAELAWALGRSANPHAAPPLARLLLDSAEAAVRYHAARGLIELAEDASVAAPALRAALHDEHGKVRLTAVEALLATGSRDCHTLEAFERAATDDPLEGVREAARAALGVRGGSEELNRCREASEEDREPPIAPDAVQDEAPDATHPPR